VEGAVWRAATMIVVGVIDLVQRTRDDHTGRVLGGHVQSAPCMWRQGAQVSWLSLETKVDGL
jgi:hypothetical protein